MNLRHVVLFAAITTSIAASAAIKLPSNLTAEATGPSGAVVTFAAGVVGSGDDENGRPLVNANCAPASGSVFALGTTTVQCSGSDGSSGAFEVTVVDTSGPALELPRDFSVPSSAQGGAVVTYQASARDAVDGDRAILCSPSSGATFPFGQTKVHCAASDSRNNHSHGDFFVTVYQQPTPPPDPQGDITREATGPDGAVVTFASNSGGQDDENGRPFGNCSPASGSTFPLGETTVQCNGGATFKVTIVDTTAPALQLPGNLTVASQGASGATVTYTASASDLVDGSVAISCGPPAGSTFPNGTTTVVCTASDTRGNDANGSFTVTVTDTPPPTDTEAPVILSLTATPNTLSPPNGKLVEVIVTAQVSDNTDAAPVVRIYDVTANETIDAEDWEITAPLTVELRARREGQNSGRIYTVHVEAIDAAGNRTVGTVTVEVPHDASGNSQPVESAPGRRRSVRG